MSEKSTFNPDLYPDEPGYIRFRAWEAVGRPETDMFGRELDVRGSPTSKGNWPDLTQVVIPPPQTPEGQAARDTFRDQVVDPSTHGGQVGKALLAARATFENDLQFAAWFSKLRQ